MFKKFQKQIAAYGSVFIIGVIVGLFLQGGDAREALNSINPEKVLGTTKVTVNTEKQTGTIVKRVVDGDTIELSSGEKVRLIGINTPETHHPTRGVECFGKEAEAYTRQLLEGHQVRLEKDVSETDRYGRLLRVVYLVPESTLAAELFVNKHLVEEGYALVDTYPPDVKYKDIFLEAQRIAREQGKGLWSACNVTN
jgi:endonuclease YncB( thermonuclease family)